jgi:flagellar assembly protein FliH
MGETMEAEQAGSKARKIQPFQYPASSRASSAPDWQGWDGSEDPGGSEDHAQGRQRTANEMAASAEFEKRLAEETGKSSAAGRERGVQEGRQAERASQATAQKAAEELRTRQAAELVESFARERDHYMHTVEHEVVKLALAVAARILRREAQMDPLLLTGAVRVALGQLSATTEVRLRVPPGDLDLWTDAIALLPNLALKPSVTAAEGMRLGDCVVETALGSVDLGIRAQLAEIERGFFDRAGAGRSSPVAEPIAVVPSSTGRETP